MASTYEKKKPKSGSTGKKIHDVITYDSFDPVALEVFYRMAAERQAIFARRITMFERPWSQDFILENEFITNMYRELDPGTIYCANEILTSEASVSDVVFNVMLYRLMGSVPDTNRAIGFQNIKGFKAANLLAKLHELPEDHKVFGDAYRVAGYHIEGGADKSENVALMFEWLAGGMKETMRRLHAARTAKEAWQVFFDLKGFGEFLAWQVTADLLAEHGVAEPVIDFGENEWAMPGPGAKNGIKAMMAEGTQAANHSIVLEWLRDKQEIMFEQYGVVFHYIADTFEITNGDGDIDFEARPRLLSLMNIQAILCEFFKYYRIWRGDQTGAVRKFPGPTSSITEQWNDIEVIGDVLPASEVCYTLTPEQMTVSDFADITMPTEPGQAGQVLTVDDGGLKWDEPADTFIGGTDPVKEGSVWIEHPAATKEYAASTVELTSADGRAVNIHITINVG